MKHFSNYVGISLLIFAQSAAVGQTLQGGIEKEDRQNQVRLQQERVNSDFGSLNANTQQDNYQRPVTEVPMQPQMPDFQRQSPQEQHGEAWYGCLGAKVDNNTGVIQIVFPESDLNRFGVVAGDRIVAVNGRPFEIRTLQSECRGLPGTPIHLITDRLGAITVMRVDSRRLAHNGKYYRKWARPIYRY